MYFNDFKYKFYVEYGYNGRITVWWYDGMHLVNISSIILVKWKSKLLQFYQETKYFHRVP